VDCQSHVVSDQRSLTGRRIQMVTARRKKREAIDLGTWRRVYAGMAMAAVIVAGRLTDANVNKLSWARVAYEWADAMLKAGEVQ
jgi:hypothetical protein